MYLHISHVLLSQAQNTASKLSRWGFIVRMTPRTSVPYAGVPMYVTTLKLFLTIHQLTKGVFSSKSRIYLWVIISHSAKAFNSVLYKSIQFFYD